MTAVQHGVQTAELAGLAGEHAQVLAETSTCTAAGLVAVTRQLGIDDLPAVAQSVSRERHRADLFRALTRDLILVWPPDTDRPGAGSRSVVAPPRLDLGEGRASWLLLIDLRQWNLRQYARHRGALRRLSGELLPLLRDHPDPHARAAASSLSQGLAASHVRTGDARSPRTRRRVRASS